MLLLLLSRRPAGISDVAKNTPRPAPVFWRQAEGNRKTDTASEFEFLPMLSRVVCDWDNRLTSD
jgi:hypothetical protein